MITNLFSAGTKLYFSNEVGGQAFAAASYIKVVPIWNKLTV
jgi:hypothetical protein